MKIGISNIAWEPVQDALVFPILREKGITDLEIVPSKYIADISNASLREIRQLEAYLKGNDLAAYAFQSLLFARPQLRLFGSQEERDHLRDYLRSLIRIAELLGVKKMVFGSPKARIIPDECGSSEEVALGFFAGIAADCVQAGVQLCLEPSPRAYQCNFLCDSDETATFVREVGSPGVRLQVDAGAMLLNEEDPFRIVTTHRDLIGHVHISEPFLKSVPQAEQHHVLLAEALREVQYVQCASVEMRDTGDSPTYVREALDFALKTYV